MGEDSSHGDKRILPFLHGSQGQVSYPPNTQIMFSYEIMMVVVGRGKGYIWSFMHAEIWETNQREPNILLYCTAYYRRAHTLQLGTADSTTLKVGFPT